MATISNPEKLVIGMYERGLVSFEDRQLSSGIISPVFIDVCSIESIDHRHPSVSPEAQYDLRETMFEAYQRQLEALSFWHIMAVPESAFSLAGSVAARSQVSVVQPRVVPKDHGEKSPIRGSIYPSETVALIDDALTSGSSVIKGKKIAEENGLTVGGVALFIDREQGGRQRLEKAGVKVEAAITMSGLLSILYENGYIDRRTQDKVQEFVAQNQF